MAAWLSRRALQRGNGGWLGSSGLTAGPTVCRRAGRLTSAPGAPGALSAVRTVEDLPRVGFLELLYRVVFQGFYKRMHELQILEKRLYGPIYRDALGQVCLNSPELLEELLRKEERFPCRADMALWKEYRDLRGLGYGPFTEEGERWYRLRAALNRRLLHPRDSAQYEGVINGVVTDFIRKIRRSPSGETVPDVANLFYLFSLEGIAGILFQARLGCLEDQIPAGTQDFIDSIAMMFSNSMAAQLLPRWARPLLPHWDRYLAGWDGIFAFAKELIDRRLELVQHRLAGSLEGEEQGEGAGQGEYLTYLLSSTQMSVQDVYGSVAELLLAGVDTTSNTLTWALYQLSKNPHIQDRLYQEVSTLGPLERPPSAAQVTRLPYLRAVIKETLRMYPVVPVNARVMMEKDVVIGGYHIPKNTLFVLAHYALSQDPDTFCRSGEFRPERWLRDRDSRDGDSRDSRDRDSRDSRDGDSRDRHHPFGSIPFGFGVRGCVGRRIAELEMYLLLTRLLRDFEIRQDPSTGDVKSINRVVLVPDQQLSLRFVDRRHEICFVGGGGDWNQT